MYNGLDGDDEKGEAPPQSFQKSKTAEIPDINYDRKMENQNHHNQRKVVSPPQLPRKDDVQKKILEQGFAKYCQQTTLHGWQYVDSEEGLVRKGLWVLVVLTVVAASVAFMVMNIQEFIKATTVTSINSTTASLKDIMFPGAIVCNVNQVSASFLANLGVKQDKTAKLLFDQFITGPKNMNATMTPQEQARLNELMVKLKTEYGWNDTVKFQVLASQNCSDMLILTEWMSQPPYKFYDAYQTATDYGACCLITPFLDFVYNKTKDKPPSTYSGMDYHHIPKGARNGIKNGLELMLDVESYDYAYFPRGAKGFRVVLADSRDKAVINQDGFYVASGTETLAALTPTVLYTTEIALSRFGPDQRDCYTDDEFRFLYMPWDAGFRYSMQNCLYESVLERIINDCTCIPNFANFRLPVKMGVCRGTNLTCATKWLRNFGNEVDPDLSKATNLQGQVHKCRQRCEIQTQSMMSTMSTYPNRQTFPYRSDFCAVLEKVVRVCKKPTRKLSLEDRYKISCSDLIGLYDGNVQLCGQEGPNGRIAEPEDLNNYPWVQEFLFQYASDNIAVLKVFIKDPYYTNIKKDEQMSYISFIGNAGGLVGLCMGLSFVSIFEMIYHCFNYCIKSLSTAVAPTYSINQ